MQQTYTKAIDERYSKLAGSSCCLSCGSALTFSSPKPGETGVDLGSGRGNDVFKIAELVGNKGYAIGIDISDGMLGKARSRAEELSIKNVSFIKSELEEITLKNEVADFVISNCTINHSYDKESVWKEIHRILKKGGRFVVSDIYSLEAVPEEFRKDPEAVAECWAGAVRKDKYLGTIMDTGFVNLKILQESEPYKKGKIEVASFTVYGEKL
jgi:ubiquinone/menaquinone biosynthesis C-methylase UbiE